jgi:hypothetical protein
LESNSQIEESGELKSTETVPSAGIWSIMLKVFTAPSAAYQALKQKPRVLWPMIIMTVMTAIAAMAMTKPSVLMQIDLMARARNIPPQLLEQIRMQMEQGGTSQMITGGLIGGVAVIIFILIAAGVAMFVGSVLMGGKAGYKSVLAVALTSGLIIGIGGLIRLPLVFLKNSILVSIGLAALMPGKDFTSILYSILYQYDFFMIWSIIVAGIGYGIIYDMPRKKGIYIAIMASIIYVILGLASSILGMVAAGIDMTFF